jgi:hypothetical protein
MKIRKKKMTKYEKTVLKIKKKYPKIENPWALAHWFIKNKIPVK